MVDWAAHRAHRAQIVEDEGQWIGLFDEDGQPLMDVPPVVSLEAPRVSMEPGSLKLTLDVAPRHGMVHPIVDELVAGGIGAALEQEVGTGALVPAMDKTRLVVIERPGARYAYKVTHCEAHGPVDAPATLDVHGVGVLDMLAGIPAPSYPGSWRTTEERGWRYFDKDWSADRDGHGGDFTRPRYMRPIDIVARADGFTHSGPATKTIRKVIEVSLAAVYDACGVVPVAQPVVVAAPARPDDELDPRVFIHPNDGFILDTVRDVAKATGVIVDARLWLPGDDAAGLPGHVGDNPVVVVDVFKRED